MALAGIFFHEHETWKGMGVFSSSALQGAEDTSTRVSRACVPATTNSNSETPNGRMSLTKQDFPRLFYCFYFLIMFFSSFLLTTASMSTMRRVEVYK